MNENRSSIVRVSCPIPGVGVAYTTRLNPSVRDTPPIGQSFAAAAPSVPPLPSYGAFNLGLHVGDDKATVQANRNQLEQAIGAQALWLHQVHGTQVYRADQNHGPWGNTPSGQAPEADASVTTQPGQACAILTADCLPVLMTSANGLVVGAAHAGWRGLANGVVASLIDAMHEANPADCKAGVWAWLGPCIGFDCFEVGPEVVAALKANQAMHEHFKPSAAGRWLADLPKIAAQQIKAELANQGLPLVGLHQDTACTFRNPSAYYSYRREAKTGRMAALIWRFIDH